MDVLLSQTSRRSWKEMTLVKKEKERVIKYGRTLYWIICCMFKAFQFAYAKDKRRRRINFNSLES